MNLEDSIETSEREAVDPAPCRAKQAAQATWVCDCEKPRPGCSPMHSSECSAGWNRIRKVAVDLSQGRAKVVDMLTAVDQFVESERVRRDQGHQVGGVQCCPFVNQ